jgi:hypothetical protein
MSTHNDREQYQADVRDELERRAPTSPALRSGKVRWAVVSERGGLTKIRLWTTIEDAEGGEGAAAGEGS